MKKFGNFEINWKFGKDLEILKNFGNLGIKCGNLKKKFESSKTKWNLEFYKNNWNLERKKFVNLEKNLDFGKYFEIWRTNLKFRKYLEM